jgi:hypothetical protein
MKKKYNSKEIIDSDDLKKNISKAIDYLRVEAYYEQINLHFRLQACDEKLYDSSKREILTKREILIDNCIDLIKQFQTNDIDGSFSSLLKKISFRLYPKSLEKDNENTDNSKGRWISNNRTQGEYRVVNCDFFIELPIELHILDTLWTMRIGRKIDAKLPESCYANRTAPEHHKNLFNLYFDQYKKWRDTGLYRAKKCLENNQSVAILSMDISRCYYSIETSWELIERKCASNSIDAALTGILKAIHSEYLSVCKPFLDDCGITINKDRKFLLPIGLSSSRILSNWEIRKWDRRLQEKLNPVYYGRYVDDMLIVLSNPPQKSSKNLQALIDHFLVDSGLVIKTDSSENNNLENESVDSSLIKKEDSPKNRILGKNEPDADIYTLAGTPFKIKGSKLIVTFFDKKHSWAGLTSFIEELQKHNSEFRFLPTDEQGRELENTAFDILMEGSSNKFRSIMAISENGTELSKFISGEIISHRLSVSPLKKTIKEQLSRFWKGRNLFDFIRIWEKNFTLLFIKNELSTLIEFWIQTEELISRLKHKNKEVRERLQNDLREHRSIAFANTISLGNIKTRESWCLILKSVSSDEISTETAKKIRSAHFCRAQYIVWPFLQFSDFEGDLSRLSMMEVIHYLQVTNKDKMDKIEESLENSFRYMYEHEKQIQRILFNACHGLPNNTTMQELANDKDSDYVDIATRCPINIILQDSPIKSKNDFVVGIANIKVSDSNIKASCEPDSSPNLSSERWETLSTLLNLASREKCDILVLPEVSIPWAWFSIMVLHAHRHNIGLIFGLEHFVVNYRSIKSVSNTVVAALPNIKSGITQCKVIARTKNHYSPGEVHEFYRLGLTPVLPDPKQYHLIHWRGMTFTIFNCFELTDIEHRGIFRGKIDAMFIVEWNPDTEYFSNIVESASRDLHCTIIQTNTSNYGDSRIYTPFYNNYDRNIIRVKGGDNTTLLKTTLNFDEQRNFQQKKYSPEDKRYKPKPAGFIYDRTFLSTEV